jgi:cytochrome oxidase Cu insertion factor (SCO1/SenC/PrrC family)
MNTQLLALPLALALAVSASALQAHDGHAKPPADAKAAPVAPVTPMAKPKRDPQAYFSDREFLTQDGQKVRFYSDVLKGRTVVLSTIYTHCEDACPLITQQLAQVRNKLGDSFGKDIFFIVISSDPERDSPQALKKYAVKHSSDGPGWIYLTGKKNDIDFVLKRLGQWSANIESHSTQLIAWSFVTDRGRKMLPNLPPEMLAAQITLLASTDGLPLSELPAARAN